MPFFKAKNHTISRSRALENMTKKNGPRHTIYNTVGDKYIGEWKDDEKSGKGVILTRNGELYEGDMKRNYRHGFGVLAQRIPNTDVFSLRYRGDWKNGRMHGTGLRIYPDESFYEGGFQNGKRHGHGQQWYLDGAFFVGEFVNDCREGLGVLIRADGNRFEGEWRQDKKHGKGVYFHLHSGQLQDGVWYDDWCIHSQIKDVGFRQCAIMSSRHPVPHISLMDPGRVCRVATEKALIGHREHCLDEELLSYDRLSVVSADSTMGLLGRVSQPNKMD